MIKQKWLNDITQGINVNVDFSCLVLVMLLWSILGSLQLDKTLGGSPPGAWGPLGGISKLPRGLNVT